MKIMFKDVSKSFDDKNVFKKFNLSIEKGDRVAIIGKSGIGKTTLINLILNKEDLDSGEIIFPEEAKFSVVFQENLLFENKSVYENILFVKNIERKKVEEYLKRLDLSGVIDEKISKLSGGMKRRVAFLRAFVYSGNIFILDEAFKELDGKTKEVLIDFINKEIKETIILTTHDREDIKLLKVNKVIDLESM